MHLTSVVKHVSFCRARQAPTTSLLCSQGNRSPIDTIRGPLELRQPNQETLYVKRWLTWQGLAKDGEKSTGTKYHVPRKPVGGYTASKHSDKCGGNIPAARIWEKPSAFCYRGKDRQRHRGNQGACVVVFFNLKARHSLACRIVARRSWS
jgi:hypothetical protein